MAVAPSWLRDHLLTLRVITTHTRQVELALLADAAAERRVVTINEGVGGVLGAGAGLLGAGAGLLAGQARAAVEMTCRVTRGRLHTCE